MSIGIVNQYCTVNINTTKMLNKNIQILKYKTGIKLLSYLVLIKQFETITRLVLYQIR